MSFSTQRDICYLVDKFHYWLLIRCMKMLAVLKRQQFKNSGNDETELKRSKHQCLNKRDNEERNSLDKDKSEIEGARYVLFAFVFLLFLPQKVSNRLSDLDKGTKSLNHLVCISKICYLRSTNFALEFLSRRDLKS